jgi:LacI family transcriptional regulator
MGKITIRDVARKANVSIGTASMALNGRNGINPGTKEKVLEAAKKLSYVPNIAAVSLVTNKSNTIGLLIPEIVNPYYSAIVDILTQLVQKAGYTLLLGISNNNSKVEKEYIESFVARQVVGVIIVPILREYPDIEHLNLLRKEKIPIVFCSDSYYECKEPCVMCDFTTGQYEITKYLISKDIKNICFVGVENQYIF